MTVQRIVAVDDEDSLLKVVRYALEQEGFEVHTAVDAAGGQMLFEDVRPDLMILDVMLPGKSGLDLAREIRQTSDVPIIILSARGDEVDRILGLEFGADDYVTKPFSPRELVSRVKSLLRRAASCGDEPASIQIGDLVIDTLSRVLQDLTFRFVGLDRETSALRPEGRLSFRELPNGVVIIDQWSLRLAGDRAQTSGATPEIGGEIARATWPDGSS
jgi:DNA-binding response OmpR family regulator